MSATEIGGNTTNILNIFQNKFILCHIRLNIYIWKTSFSPLKSISLVFSSLEMQRKLNISTITVQCRLYLIAGTYYINNPADNCMFRVKNKSTRTRCAICSKLTIKTPKQRQWLRSGVFLVNFEHLSHFVLLFLFSNFEQVNTDWKWLCKCHKVSEGYIEFDARQKVQKDKT